MKDEKICVVVSAMYGDTNKLLDLIKNISGNIPNSPECDRVLSSGENISAGLLALSLESIGVKSRSMCAYDLPIYTTGDPTNSKIHSIDTSIVKKLISEGVIPIITGFQGIDMESKSITTIGRGGSDTTAVAISHFINAKRCDIYTDIDGVYEVDPHVNFNAKRINSLKYDEMIKLTEKGAKVLQRDSVIFAMEKEVPVRVLSTFYNIPGTDIKNNGDKLNEAKF